jgi:large subunit ribosomal protein L32
MAVPKRRMSHARQGNRRSHHHIDPRQLCYCNRCGQPVKSGHYACSNCGWCNAQKRELVAMERKEE